MVFPAHAGVILVSDIVGTVQDCFPRTRGGDPWLAGEDSKLDEFSPHTRG